MLIVPAIDLRNGRAVRAIAGRRDRYRPLSSRLCPDSEPLQLVRALLSLYPFSAIYLADLDAIEGSGNNRLVIERLLARFPDLTFWLDAGFSRFDDLTLWPDSTRLRPVLGSESQIGSEACQALRTQCRERNPLLSLDFKGGDFLGPIALLDSPEIWPQDIILMTLDRVGAEQGPDSERLASVKSIAKEKRFFAAGGVRDKTDLRRLETKGYTGVLVASALHDGGIRKDDMVAFNRRD